jgi:hypothetical protein
MLPRSTALRLGALPPLLLLLLAPLLLADGSTGLGGSAALLALPPPPPAPSTFTVTFFTDVKSTADVGAGDIAVTVTRSWAPIGADRFYAAVNAGFYNKSAFFRVVAPNASGCVMTCGGIVQFGISGSKSMNDQWLHSSIKDDPVTQSNTAGMVRTNLIRPAVPVQEKALCFLPR